MREKPWPKEGPEKVHWLQVSQVPKNKRELKGGHLRKRIYRKIQGNWDQENRSERLLLCTLHPLYLTFGIMLPGGMEHPGKKITIKEKPEPRHYHDEDSKHSSACKRKTTAEMSFLPDCLVSRWCKTKSSISNHLLPLTRNRVNQCPKSVDMSRWFCISELNLVE